MTAPLPAHPPARGGRRPPVDKRPKLSSFTPLDGLTLVFIHLKLSNNIDWSWWLILLPMIISIVGAMFVSIVDELLKNR